MGGPRSSRTRLNQAGLGRDLDLLHALGEAPGPLGVVRLAELVGRDKSQVSRALASLAEAGVVERVIGGYRVGPAVFALAARSVPARLAAVAAGHLARLSARTGETCHLCVLSGNDVLTVASHAGEQAFRSLSWEGRAVPVPMLSAGRVLVSDLPPEVILTRWPDEAFAAVPQRQHVRSGRDLVRACGDVRRTGVSIVVDEFEPGVSGLSAPVRDLSGRIVAAINLTMPTARIKGREAVLADAVRETAADLSRDVGMEPAGTG
jgi:DNA-binding IclR family transcriptional regulator